MSRKELIELAELMASSSAEKAATQCREEWAEALRTWVATASAEPVAAESIRAGGVNTAGIENRGVGSDDLANAPFSISGGMSRQGVPHVSPDASASSAALGHRLPPQLHAHHAGFEAIFKRWSEDEKRE